MLLLIHGGSVIPNCYCQLFYEVYEIFVFSHVAYELVENLGKLIFVFMILDFVL